MNSREAPRWSAGPEAEQVQRHFAILHDPASSLERVTVALVRLLEPSQNQGDCFWISHAWAESLIQGKTIEKRNFPSNGVSIQHDPAWKKDMPDYKGAHVSHGAESYIITSGTRGTNGNFKPREYTKLLSFARSEVLIGPLERMAHGRLVMLLTATPQDQDAHALLALKLHTKLVFIDNSFEPGAWIKSWEEFEEEWGAIPCSAYVYPEKIHGA